MRHWQLGSCRQLLHPLAIRAPRNHTRGFPFDFAQIGADRQSCSPSPVPMAASPPPTTQPQQPLSATSLEYQQAPQNLEPNQHQEHDNESYDLYDFSAWGVTNLINNPNQPTSNNAFDVTSPTYDYSQTIPYPSPTYAYPRQPLTYHLYTAPPPPSLPPRFSSQIICERNYMLGQRRFMVVADLEVIPDCQRSCTAITRWHRWRVSVGRGGSLGVGTRRCTEL